MPTELFEFSWEVPPQGYEWVYAKPGTGPTRALQVHSRAEKRKASLYLVPSSPEMTGPMRRYQPLIQETGLFQILADTETTEAGILAFANRYGRLGDTGMDIVRASQTKHPQSTVRRGESYDAWMDTILALRFCIRLWRLAKENDRRSLPQYIRWLADDEVVCASDPQWFTVPLNTPIPAGHRSWKIRLDWAPGFREHIHPGDMILPALYSVQFEINRHLSGVGATLLWNRTHTRQELCFVPLHLSSALWLQFAQAVDGNKGYRQCLRCSRWFEVSPRTARADKVFCTNACRSGALRSRQLEAHRLFDQGKHLKEIATQLRSSVSVVRRWIRSQV
jgi:hypothetical protein